MRFRRHRKPPQPPQPAPTSPLQIVDLSTWNGQGEDVLTPIARPDSLTPVPHRLPALDPDQADLRLLVTQLIADLHARGALDAGHAAVLDHWIDSQVPGWLAVIDQQAHERRRIGELLVAVDRANLTREASELVTLRTQQLDAETAYRNARDQLTGLEVTPTPAVTPQQAAAAPPMPTLPDFRPTTYLADRTPTPAVTDPVGGPGPADRTGPATPSDVDLTDRTRRHDWDAA